MDADFIRAVVIACIFIGIIVLFVWMTSRAKRGVVKAVKQAQEVLKLTPVVRYLIRSWVPYGMQFEVKSPE